MREHGEAKGLIPGIILDTLGNLQIDWYLIEVDVSEIRLIYKEGDGMLQVLDKSIKKNSFSVTNCF